jgi:prepilin-type N-terminal cleavage/methylation domain-containing protein
MDAMEKKRADKQAGFTLVELLVSVLLTSFIMGAVYSVYRVQMHSGKVQENRLVAQEYARNVLDMMVREMRNTGYFPVGACTTTPANNNGIIQADAQNFRFVYDANGANGCADPDENIWYKYQTTGCTSSGDIIRDNGTALPLTECNVTNLNFRYFQQDGTELTSPVALANVQRILITLTVQSKNPDYDINSVSGGQLNATVTSNVDLRNRGL